MRGILLRKLVLRAVEQGPSCKTLEQIPDMKVIYVRFVTGDIQDCVPEWGISKSDLEMVGSHSHTLTRLRGPPLIHQKLLKVAVLPQNSSKFAPLSLSAADMIKLGKIGTAHGPTTVVNLNTFDRIFCHVHTYFK